MVNNKKNACFILNPFSGVKDNDYIRQSIEQHIDKNQYEFEIIDTQYAGHATILAKDAVKRGCDVVVAVGGDGTINEVAAALAHTDVTLGVLPAGSGNGFAMHIGMGRNIVKAVEILNTCKSEKIDVCYINDTPYINLAGVGFDATIAYKYKRTQRRGFIGYLKFSLKEAIHIRFQKFVVKVDGKEIADEFLTIAIANAPMYGYNFVIAPMALYNDGKLEVVLIKKMPVWRYFFSLWRLLNKSIHKSSIAECYKAETVEILCDSKTYAHIDGEGFEINGKQIFTVKPSALNVLIPVKH
jgi:diacylglycerol kinase (ATP)